MRYLVTGGAGFIGSHLVDALILRGDTVLVLDNLSTGRRENLEHVLDAGTVELVEGSVVDETLVEECLQATDACFHLASTVGVQLIVERPLESLLNNMRGSETVISAASRLGRRVLFTSTSEIYGKNSQAGLTEDSDRILGAPSKSRWSYSLAKAFGETLAYELHRERGAQTVVVRLFNTVGPRQTGRYGMVVPRFVGQALAGEDLTVYGNGMQTRCFSHVLDVVQALTMVMDSDLAVGRAFNVGSQTELAVIELARRVIERTSSRSRIRLVPYDEAFAGDGFEELGRRMPDTTALERLTGWTPTRTIDDAIEDILAQEEHRRLAAAAEKSLVP